ncbi:ROK family protein [Ruminiclostridium herbifermentans]|uniref:ROK family protein n=1 Tax=Ruminiclostridium herbifermentans TaxID=2488810 RepID=A0A4U7JN06_9FIRM|nr:ROK family protein [Ruminiclostridium herbifermentans]QNU65264.1 ROK family protein [Ruminiclostridium herbifermentans]
MDISDIIKNLSMESKKILSLLLHNQPFTKAVLSELSGLKLTSLNRMMLPLEEAELIVKCEIGESTGGRKPVLYDVNPYRYFIIGIDISRTYTQVVLINFKMQFIEKNKFDMNKESTPSIVVNLISSWIDKVIEKLRKQHGTIIGIGIGTVGPLDRKKGVVLNPDNFRAKGWEDVPLKSIFEERYGIPVVIDNGANAAVLAETYYGLGKGIKNVIYINCGIGIRTGVISSGVFVRNINDADDAFAHMIVDLNGRKCSCGNVGCIEAYASIYSINQVFTELCNKTLNYSDNIEQLSYIDICKAAESGEPIAMKVIEDSATIMGNGLANLIQLLNPGIVILSGPLLKHSELFYQISTDTAYKRINKFSKDKIFFNRGGYFKEDAISVGAAAILLESFLDNACTY